MVRHLLKAPLSLEELKALSKLTGGPEELVAPKRRKEAEGLSGDALLRWLAEDGGRVRRPIVVVGEAATLGFNASAQAALAKLL